MQQKGGDNGTAALPQSGEDAPSPKARHGSVQFANAALHGGMEQHRRIGCRSSASSSRCGAMIAYLALPAIWRRAERQQLSRATKW